MQVYWGMGQKRRQQRTLAAEAAAAALTASDGANVERFVGAAVAAPVTSSTVRQKDNDAERGKKKLKARS